MRTNRKFKFSSPPGNPEDSLLLDSGTAAATGSGGSVNARQQSMQQRHRVRSALAALLTSFSSSSDMADEPAASFVREEASSEMLLAEAKFWKAHWWDLSARRAVRWLLGETRAPRRMATVCPGFMGVAQIRKTFHFCNHDLSQDGRPQGPTSATAPSCAQGMNPLAKPLRKRTV